MKVTRNICYTYDEVLVSLIRWLSLLFPSTHEASPRQDSGLDLREVYLDHHSFLSSIPVSDFRDTVSWSADLQEDLALHIVLSRGNHKLRLLCITSGAPCKVCLMFLPLCMGEVRSFVGVQRQT